MMDQEQPDIFKRAIYYNTLDEEPISFGKYNKGVYCHKNGTQIDKINKDDGCAEFDEPIKVPEGYKNGVFFLPFKIYEAENSQYTMFGVYKKDDSTDLNRRLFN